MNNCRKIAENQMAQIYFGNVLLKIFWMFKGECNVKSMLLKRTVAQLLFKGLVNRGYLRCKKGTCVSVWSSKKWSIRKPNFELVVF